jgi:hypothetical protein
MIRPGFLLGAALALLLPLQDAFAQQRPAGTQPGARPPAGGPGGVQRAAPRQPRSGTPTEQLFEAINEGEMEDVRAAVAAGADIGARNLLGLTPVDLAVDLGRNDVALYLLSLGRVRERPLGALPQEQQPAPRVRTPATNAATPRAVAPPVSGQGIVAVAPLWRGDGGAPNTEIGFLGFDAGRPEGARAPASSRQAPPAAARATPAREPARAPAARQPVAREALPPG